MCIVYLIHFDRPYKHARHYLGSADDLGARLIAHRAGNGARLLEVIQAAGIEWNVVRTWEGERALERDIKRANNTPRLCPICNPRGWAKRRQAGDCGAWLEAGAPF